MKARPRADSQTYNDTDPPSFSTLSECATYSPSAMLQQFKESVSMLVPEDRDRLLSRL